MYRMIRHCYAEAYTVYSILMVLPLCCKQYLSFIALCCVTTLHNIGSYPDSCQKVECPNVIKAAISCVPKAKRLAHIYTHGRSRARGSDAIRIPIGISSPTTLRG